MCIRVLREKREDTLAAESEQCGGGKNGNQKREIGAVAWNIVMSSFCMDNPVSRVWAKQEDYNPL
jgi:hypothetical protein